MTSGSAAISTAVPSSSVRVTGNAAAGEGLGSVLGGGDGVMAGADDGAAAGVEQAANMTIRARDMATPRGRERGDTAGFLRERCSWSRRGLRYAQDPSLRGWSKEGSGDGVHGPAYLSLEGSSMHRGVGDRTSARGRFTVAGLCRNLTGFATTRRSTDVGA